MQPLNLLFEKPDYSHELDVIVEEKNTKEGRNTYISGIYMMAESENKNGRKYKIDEMINEVDRYQREFIKTGRSLGELNHPAQSAEVDLKNACHMVVSMGVYRIGWSYR